MGVWFRITSPCTKIYQYIDRKKDKINLKKNNIKKALATFFPLLIPKKNAEVSASSNFKDLFDNTDLKLATFTSPLRSSNFLLNAMSS